MTREVSRKAAAVARVAPTSATQRARNLNAPPPPGFEHMQQPHTGTGATPTSAVGGARSASSSAVGGGRAASSSTSASASASSKVPKSFSPSSKYRKPSSPRAAPVAPAAALSDPSNPSSQFFSPFRVSAQKGLDRSELIEEITEKARRETIEAMQRKEKKQGGAATKAKTTGGKATSPAATRASAASAASAATSALPGFPTSFPEPAASEEPEVEMTAEEIAADEEDQRREREAELDFVRGLHFDLEAWKLGGTLPYGRVMDVDPTAAPLTPEERATVLVELAVVMPLAMAEFGSLNAEGFRDDGSPLQEFHAASESPEDMELATHPAHEWIDVQELAEVMDLQDSFPAPTPRQIEEVTAAERKSGAARRRGDMYRRRYCALVSHAAWSWNRVKLLLDSPAGWTAEEKGLRYRFLGEQLQRTYLSALQSIAYFAKHARFLAALGDAADGMARQSWLHFADVASRMSHTQEEALTVYEHVDAWAQEDAVRGNHAPHETSHDIKREMAMVYAFCGSGGQAVTAEREHLIRCAERVQDSVEAMRVRALDTPEYGQQHYTLEALQSLTRVSAAMLPEMPSPEQLAALQKKTEAAGPDAPPPPSLPQRDVLGAVHAAQFAVGIAWRWAGTLSERSHELLAREMAEGQARSSGDTETADRLATHAAFSAAELVARLVEQHVSPATPEELDLHGLLSTALMQEKRSGALTQGLETFLHFTDRVPHVTQADQEAAAMIKGAAAASNQSPADAHEWGYHALSLRADCAAAYQQLGMALEAWLHECESDKSTLPRLAPREVAQLHHCTQSAYETAQQIAAIKPNAAAAARVVAELDQVETRVPAVLEQVRAGKPLADL